MPGLALAVVLGFELLLVYITHREYPLRPKHPLDVDDHLPLPELAQTSTVFSLTALFGAYFGVAVTLGLPALLGLACGTVLGLILVSTWIHSTLNRRDPKGSGSFEDFLSEVLQGTANNRMAFGLLVAGVQCLYAISELLILRELAKAALGLADEQATLMAIGVGIFGYFCVLFGGYVTLFRTDIFQLVLVILMAIVFGVALLANHSAVDWSSKLLPKAGFWEMPVPTPKVGLYALHFLIGLVMGAGLLLASPDTWKRVFQVNKKRPKFRSRYMTFVSVGMLPYIILLPFAITLNPRIDCGDKAFVLPAGLINEWLFMFIALGLAASFLSSFNSALLGSVHVGLILKRHHSNTPYEESRFYWLMVTVLIAIAIVFSVALQVLNNPWPFGLSNPWLLGNLLMGAYAIIAGIVIGTRGKIPRLRKDHLLWIAAVGICLWAIGLYMFRKYAGLSGNPSLCSVNSVPIGVGLFVIVTGLTALLTIGGSKDGRH
jgi:hypothetical protein